MADEIKTPYDEPAEGEMEPTDAHMGEFSKEDDE